MKLRVVCVGRKARDPLLEAADRFAERLGHYCKLDLRRVREGDLNSERDRLLGEIPAGARVIALDERGTQLSTEKLAETVGRWRDTGVQVAMLIGGADGLHPDIRARADQIWSLSKMTLPHRMALVLLLEQLYRAHTILRGEPYHRR